MFCDQKKITGQSKRVVNFDTVSDTLKDAFEKISDEFTEVEIAFFGGSFTAINKEYMIELLEAAYPYVESKQCAGIRISTRPDAIDSNVLSILKRYGVTAIELGAQSMSDRVLELNERGHDAKAIRQASYLIKENGFSLGLQMMVGLYGSDVDSEWYTAEQFAKLLPDTVRIYPTVVLENTRLAELMRKSLYMPMNFDDMVEICAKLLVFFEDKGIKVIRCGLHDSKSLRANMIGGVFHPAFREICESKIFFDRCVKLLTDESGDGREVVLRVNPKDLSKALGHKKKNLISLNDMGYRVRLVQDERVPKGQMRIGSATDSRTTLAGNIFFSAHDG